jgi:DNA-binding transcriptional LysR family regulator
MRIVPLKPRHFEIFHAVAAAGSVTEAARRLAVSQPAVSKYLRELEADVGLKLRDRDGNLWHLTPEGQLLHEQVARDLAGFARTLRFARELKGTRKGFLALGCMPLLSARLLPELLAAFLAERPHVSVSVVNQHSASVLDQVALGRLDLGLGLDAPSHQQVASRPLAALEVLCVVPRGHKLAGRSTVDLAALDGADVVTLGTADPVQGEIDRLFAARGVRPRRRIEATMAQAAVEFARRGLGVGIVDSHAARMFAGRGMRAVPLATPVSYRIALLTRRGAVPSQAAAEFAAMVEAWRWPPAEGFAGRA